MNELIIGLVAVGEQHSQRAKILINQILNITYVDFIILTNQPDIFDDIPSLNIILYKKEIFSYHDKLIIFEEGFKIKECVLLLDADHVVRESNQLLNIDLTSLSSGVYPQLIWKHPVDCSLQNFILGKVDRVPYGIEYKKHCDDLGLLIDDAMLIQESFILIKKDKNTQKLISIWKQLADFCNNKDKERNQCLLGYGEGYSIGVAIKNSNSNIFENIPQIQNLYSSFKHLAWER